MTRDKAFWLSRILAALCVVTAVGSFLVVRGTLLHLVLLGIAIVTMMAATYILATYYRCPHCDAKLDPWGKKQKKCSQCGKEL